MEKILEKLEARIKELKDSLEKNSWDYCDDDEQPDFDQKMKDHSEIDGINFAIKTIKKTQMDKEDKRRAINPIVKKKHVQVLEEVERRLKANAQYCVINSCEPTQYMCGQNDVLSDLIVFINKL